MVCVWRRYAGKTDGGDGGRGETEREGERENQRGEAGGGGGGVTPCTKVTDDVCFFMLGLGTE